MSDREGEQVHSETKGPMCGTLPVLKKRGKQREREGRKRRSKEGRKEGRKGERERVLTYLLTHGTDAMH